MSKTTALSEARSTCDGLHRLIRKIGNAAEDIDKGGNSSYEMLALIASANTCILNLETQLTLLEASDSDDSNVFPLKREDTQTHSPPETNAAAKR